MTRFIMATIGRGGDGDVGQRIRDEILVVQRNNNCMGGMMEEWHQKLHNNTSPDDVPICEALLKFIAADCDISVYWDHLHANGITKERMASYDRKICGEPSFKPDQYEGLTRDLKEYLRTLKAVHSGADLDSAAENVMGYHQDACKGKEINMPPVTEVATDRMRTLLHSARFRDPGEPLHSMEAMLEARRELWNWTRPGGADNSRLKDVIYLDLALESAVRQVVEANLSSMATRAPVDVLKMTGLALENLALSSGGNDELVICLQQWQGVVGSAMNGGNDWALQAKSVVDRVNNALGEVSQRYINALQPTAHAMGGRLGVDGHVLDIFSEEVVRGTPAAPLSQRLRALDPRLREMSNMGSWSIVSPSKPRATSRSSPTSRMSRTKHTPCPPCWCLAAWAARRTSRPAWWVSSPQTCPTFSLTPRFARGTSAFSSPPSLTPVACPSWRACTARLLTARRWGLTT